MKRAFGIGIIIKIIFFLERRMSMVNEIITKEDYEKLRLTQSRTQIRTMMKIGPIRFDQMLSEIGVDVEADKAHRIKRSKI